MGQIVYKILRGSEWEQAQKAGLFHGSADDVRDGFVHLSAAQQLRATAAKHFAGEDALVLLAIDGARLGAALKWEASRGGEDFPHLYGPLALDAVSLVVPMARDASGRHILPDEIP